MFLLDRCSIQSKRIKVYYAQLIKIHSFAIKERNSWPRQSYLTTRLCVRNNYTPAPFVFLLLLLFTHFTSENIFYPLSRNAHIILNKASQFFALFSSRKCTRDQINSRFRKTETQGRGGSDEGRKKKEQAWISWIASATGYSRYPSGHMRTKVNFRIVPTPVATFWIHFATNVTRGFYSNPWSSQFRRDILWSRTSNKLHLWN